MQTAALLPPSRPDLAATAAAAAHGIEVCPMSIFQIERTDINGLLLGFANASPKAIRKAAEKLATALKGMKRSQGPVGRQNVPDAN
jgi:DNA-binding transcriptional MocR family regulator